MNACMYSNNQRLTIFLYVIAANFAVRFSSCSIELVVHYDLTCLYGIVREGTRGTEVLGVVVRDVRISAGDVVEVGG